MDGLEAFTLPVHGYALRKANVRDMLRLTYFQYECLKYLQSIPNLQGMTVRMAAVDVYETLVLVLPDRSRLICADTLGLMFSCEISEWVGVIPTYTIKANFVDESQIKSSGLANQGEAEPGKPFTLGPSKAMSGTTHSEVVRNAYGSTAMDDDDLEPPSGVIISPTLTKMLQSTWPAGGLSVESRYGTSRSANIYFNEDGNPNVKAIYKYFSGICDGWDERFYNRVNKNSSEMEFFKIFFGRKMMIYEYVILFVPLVGDLTVLQNLSSILAEFRSLGRYPPDHVTFNDRIKPRVYDVFDSRGLTIIKFLMNLLPGPAQFPFFVTLLYHQSTFHVFSCGKTVSQVTAHTYSGGQSKEAMSFGRELVDFGKVDKTLTGNPHVTFNSATIGIFPA